MRVNKGPTKKASISPSQELWEEAEHQAETGIFDSKTDFFETAGWLLVELQRFGMDMARVQDGPGTSEASREMLEGSAVKLSVEVHHAG